MSGCGRAALFPASHPCASFSVPSVVPNPCPTTPYVLRLMAMLRLFLLCSLPFAFRRVGLAVPPPPALGRTWTCCPCCRHSWWGSSLWVCSPAYYLVWLQVLESLGVLAWGLPPCVGVCMCVTP